MYRIDKLLKQEQRLFHTKDLALLWNISNKNTLYTTIKRYCQKKILIPIHKGFYAVVGLNQIDPVRLAIGYLHRYAYVSCETILLKQGIIFQKGNYITLNSNISKKFTINDRQFLIRKLKDKFLFNNLGINNDKGIMIANLDRAVADMLYFNPNYHFDNRKGINWTRVRQMQKEVGYL